MKDSKGKTDKNRKSMEECFHQPTIYKQETTPSIPKERMFEANSTKDRMFVHIQE